MKIKTALLLLTIITAASLTTTANATTSTSPNYQLNGNDTITKIEASSISYSVKSTIGQVTTQETTSSPSYKLSPATVEEALLAEIPYTIEEALSAIQIATGIKPASQSLMSRLDVAPMLNGVSIPDGQIDIKDAIVILRKTVGL